MNFITEISLGVSLGTRASEAASIDGVWAYGRNFSVCELGRGHD